MTAVQTKTLTAVPTKTQTAVPMKILTALPMKTLTAEPMRRGNREANAGFILSLHDLISTVHFNYALDIFVFCVFATKF